MRIRNNKYITSTRVTYTTSAVFHHARTGNVETVTAAAIAASANPSFPNIAQKVST